MFDCSTRVPYGEKGEKFTYPMTLVCFQCVVNSIFAFSSKLVVFYFFELPETFFNHDMMHIS